MRVQNLWGGGRSPSFIFLVYLDTVLVSSRNLGQATICSWSNGRSAMWPKGQMSTVAGKSRETLFFSQSHMGSLGLWEMMGLLCEVGAGC